MLDGNSVGLSGAAAFLVGAATGLRAEPTACDVQGPAGCNSCGSGTGCLLVALRLSTGREQTDIALRGDSIMVNRAIGSGDPRRWRATWLLLALLCTCPIASVANSRHPKMRLVQCTSRVSEFALSPDGRAVAEIVRSKGVNGCVDRLQIGRAHV